MFSNGGVFFLEDTRGVPVAFSYGMVDCVLVQFCSVMMSTMIPMASCGVQFMHPWEKNLYTQKCKA